MREPVRATGMGEITAPRDAAGLAAAITKVLGDRASYVKPQEQISQTFNATEAVDFYEDLFLSLTGGTPVSREPVTEKHQESSGL